MSDMTVPNTIVQQIQDQDPRAFYAWGAKNFVGDDNSLRFKSSGFVKNKGVVRITLNSMDLYDVEFGEVRVGVYKRLNRLENLFVDQVIQVVDEMVG